jgi:hypothetical protein
MKQAQGDRNLLPPDDARVERLHQRCSPKVRRLRVEQGAGGVSSPTSCRNVPIIENPLSLDYLGDDWAWAQRINSLD